MTPTEAASATLVTDDSVQQVLRRIREAPDCRRALEKLSGDVLDIIVTGHSVYRLVFSDGDVHLDPSATATISVEGSAEVIDAIFCGTLDPLVAMLTRRLKTRIDPVRGPVLRSILRAGIGTSANDMSWERVIGRAPRN
jgi:hypothetical protein